MGNQEAPLDERIQELIALAARAAGAYGRTDLADKLETLAPRLAPTTAKVLVAGEFKAGKSSLVNALIGADVCPVDDDVATSVLTVVGAASSPGAAVAFVADGGIEYEAIELSDVPRWVTEHGDLRGGERAVARVEIGLPSPLLAEGLLLIDTPGAGGLGGPHSALTMAAAPMVDAVVFVSSSVQEFTASERDFLAQVARLCPLVLVVESKTDLHTRWRDVVDRDREHLRVAEISAEAVGVSALVRGLAMERGSDELDDESGAPALVDWLVDRVVKSARQRSVSSSIAAVRDAIAQLRSQFTVERDALTDEKGPEELVSKLAFATEEAERAKGAASRWAQALNDSFSDLSSELERELRSHMRALSTEADTAIDRIDPARGWSDFERSLYERATTAASDHCALRHDRLLDAIGHVTALFGDDEGAYELVDATGSGSLDDLAAASIDLKRSHVIGQSLTLLRSSYGGLAMLGFLGSFAGIAVAAPVLLGVGVVLGGKGLKDERDRQLAQRRAQAKAAARRYLDDVSYALSAETRDIVRHAQREVRDYCATRAQERQRMAADGLAVTRQSVDLDAATRTKRLKDVDAELHRIDALDVRAIRLLEAQP